MSGLSSRYVNKSFYPEIDNNTYNDDDLELEFDEYLFKIVGDQDQVDLVNLCDFSKEQKWHVFFFSFTFFCYAHLLIFNLG